MDSSAYCKNWKEQGEYHFGQIFTKKRKREMERMNEEERDIKSGSFLGILLSQSTNCCMLGLCCFEALVAVI